MKKIIIIYMCLIGNNMMAQESKVLSFAIGSFEISMLNENRSNGNTGLLVGATPAILQQYAPDGSFPMATNAFLVKMSGKNILIDAGYGTSLVDNLLALGVTPDKIDIILLTHMHGDHIGGLLKDGKTVFPNAAFYLAKPEHDYWTSSKEMEKVAENRRGGFLQAQAVIKAYKTKLHLFTPVALGSKKANLISGVQAIAAYGHTPGHTAFLFTSGDARLLVWGDLTHAMAVQMPHPEVALSFDVNPVEAVTNRKTILEYVVKHKIPIAGMHIVPPGIGNVKTSDKVGEAYQFELFDHPL